MAAPNIRKSCELGYEDKSHYHIWHACIDCGKGRWVRYMEGKPESSRCRSCSSRLKAQGRTGENSPFWKGGRKVNGQGYILVLLQPDDFFYPMAKSSGYVLEHRLVVAKALGRCLHSWEIVHHKKGYAKDDNRYPETLELVMEGQHNQITIMENRIKFLEQRVTLLEAENILMKRQQREGHIYNG